MEFIIYKIKDEDTFASIAKEHAISVAELINFHNSHSKMTQQIFSDHIPLHLESLYLKKRVENNDQFKISSEILDIDLNYKINFGQKLQANEKSLANTNTEIFWKIKYAKINYKTVVEIVTESCEVTNQPGGTVDLINFAKVFNFPTNKLILELDDFGAVKTVLNQTEIYEKWQIVRKNELHSYEAEESMKAILVAGEIEFSDTLQSLLNNPLYFLFFDRIYGINSLIVNYNNMYTKIYSKLFQGEKITLNKKQVVETDNNFIVKNEYLNSFADKKKLKENFLINYKDLVGNEWDYNNSIVSNATYDLNKGILKHLSAICIEKANNNLYHESIYAIEQIKQKL